MSLLASFLPFSEARPEEIYTHQVWVQCGRNFRPVVGANDNRAIVLMEDKSTKEVSVRKWKILGKHLPSPGLITIISRHSQQASHVVGAPPAIRIEFITDRDYDNLYAVYFIRDRKGRSVKEIGVCEIGPVEGEKRINKAIQLSFSTTFQGELNWKNVFTELNFYSNGFQLKRQRRTRN